MKIDLAQGAGRTGATRFFPAALAAYIQQSA